METVSIYTSYDPDFRVRNIPGVFPEAALRTAIWYPFQLTPQCDHRHRRQSPPADSEVKYRQYFNVLHKNTSQYNVEPRHKYNLDGTGFFIGIVDRSKRVFSR